MMTLPDAVYPYVAACVRPGLPAGYRMGVPWYMTSFSLRKNPCGLTLTIIVNGRITDYREYRPVTGVLEFDHDQLSAADLHIGEPRPLI